MVGLARNQTGHPGNVHRFDPVVHRDGAGAVPRAVDGVGEGVDDLLAAEAWGRQYVDDFVATGAR